MSLREQRPQVTSVILPISPVNKTGPDFTSRSKPEIEDTVMNRTAFAIAAALLAGTTLTSAANAGGLRVGFGFPLGSFIAHSNQNYSDNDYGCRHCDRPHYAARHVYEDDAPVHKVKHTPKVDTAEVSQPTTCLLYTSPSPRDS